jgi:hypothetical protein
MKFSAEFNNAVSRARALSLPDRLTEATRFLERLDRERASLSDPTLGRIIEERIISRELLDLELQDFDEEVERRTAVAQDFLTREMTAAAREPSFSTSEAYSLSLCRSAS